MRTKSIPPPSPPPSLPEHLEAALRMLQRTRGLLAEGDVTLVAMSARAAFERAIKWLEIEGHVSLPPFRGGGANVHDARAQAAAAVLGLPLKSLQRLLRHAEADEYGDQPGGKSVDYRESYALASVRIAGEAIRAVVAFGAARGLLTSDQEREAALVLGDERSPGSLERLIQGTHRGVVDAQFGPMLDDQLMFLIRATARPKRARERLRAGQVSVITAWRALNQGHLDGPSGAIAWAERGVSLLRPEGDQRAIVEGYIIQAIAERFRGNHARAIQLLQYAEQVAAGNAALTHDARTQLTLTASELNADADVVRSAHDVAAAAEDTGDPRWVANQRMMLGKVLDRAGRHSDAEREMQEGFESQTKLHAMSRAVGARYLMQLYAGLGLWSEAVRWAKRLKRIAAPRGLSKHLNDANIVLREGGRARKSQGGAKNGL